MSIIDRILGRTPAEGPQIRAPGKPAAPVTEMPATAISAGATALQRTPNAAEGVVRVYDQFGRAITIGREAWRRDVLLPNLAANRDNPDALYELVVSALNDDFATDVLESARWLADTDRDPQRGATVLGVVLLQIKDHDGGARSPGTRHRAARRERLSTGQPGARVCGGSATSSAPRR